MSVSRHTTHKKNDIAYDRTVFFSRFFFFSGWNVEWMNEERGLGKHIETSERIRMLWNTTEHCSVRVFSLHGYINSILRLKRKVTPTQFTKFLVVGSLYHSFLLFLFSLFREGGKLRVFIISKIFLVYEWKEREREREKSRSAAIHSNKSTRRSLCGVCSSPSLLPDFSFSDQR